MSFLTTIRSYDIINLLLLFRDILVGKLFLGIKIRKVRFPYYIIGKKYIKFGKEFTAGVNLRIEAKKETKAEPQIEFGDDVKMNDYVHIACNKKVIIGKKVLIGSNVLITDHNHGNYSGDPSTHTSPLTPPDDRLIYGDPVYIGDNVWIGDFVAILKGSKIGEGCIIGAMSVVQGTIPPYCIVAGAPAKVIKKYNFDLKCWERI